MIACILHPSCFCEIWALCVSWITYDYLYYAPCLVCWALFGSLVPVMCNHTSSAQVHELPKSHSGDNRESTLFSWFHVYYTHLASVRFEHCVCHESLMITWRRMYQQISLSPWAARTNQPSIIPRSVIEYQIILGLNLCHKWWLLPSKTTGGVTNG